MLHALRTASTRRLVGTIGAALAIAVSGVAFALAAGGGGPVPAPKPLATAIHDALAAPAVDGVTANIKFTNRLIDAASLVGADPILSGASGRLWALPDGHLRIELQSDRGDAQILSDGKTVTIYDAAAKTVYKIALPKADGKRERAHGLPTIAEIQRHLNDVLTHATLVTKPTDVANRPAYNVRISPRHDGGLLGRAELAWDAIAGVPLRAAVYATGSDTPVLELTATDISFGKVDRSTFAVTPPSSAKVIDFSPPDRTASGHGGKVVSGLAAVAKQVPFTVSAPAKLVGLPRHGVRLFDWDGKPGVLVTYGAHLGGIAVLEQAADAAGSGTGLLPSLPKKGDRHDHGNGLSLPSVSINGVTGQELDTALGSMVRFTRAGVTYTVLGSVPPAAAEAAARAL